MSVSSPPAALIPDSVARLRAALGPDMPGTAMLWPSLSRLEWAMVLPSSSAPGFVYLAGSCGGTAVGGGGRDLAEAAGKLAGEAAEVQAQTATPDFCEDPGDPEIDAIWTDGMPSARVPAENLTRARRVGVPASAIFPAVPRCHGAPPSSLGFGAGPDRASAQLSGLLELVERDAAARWWRGDTRPRSLDVGLTAPAATDLARMRLGAVAPGRPTGFLALPSPTGLPVVCASSGDAEGHGLAFGLKAALDPRTAVMGALLELLQMELGLEIARLRAAQGREAPGDAGPLARAALRPDAHDAFAPLPPAGALGPSIAGLDDLVAHLAALGFEVTVANLRGPRGGLRVAKAFVPGLHPLPGATTEPRPGAPACFAELM